MCSGGLRGALDILKASGTGSHSYDQEKKLPRCCTTITTLSGTTDFSGPREESYSFTTVQQLVANFSSEVNRLRGETK